MSEKIIILTPEIDGLQYKFEIPAISEAQAKGKLRNVLAKLLEQLENE